MSSDNVDSGRRKFINLLLGGSAVGLLGSLIYPLTRFLVPPKSLEANPTTLKVEVPKDFGPGKALMFKYGRKPGILIQTADGELKAFSAVCTHLDCTVQYKPEWGVIWCACHNGRYDLTGRNIAGPPPRPLTPFSVNVKDGEIYVSEEAS